MTNVEYITSFTDVSIVLCGVNINRYLQAFGVTEGSTPEGISSYDSSIISNYAISPASTQIHLKYFHTSDSDDMINRIIVRSIFEITSSLLKKEDRFILPLLNYISKKYAQGDRNSAKITITKYLSMQYKNDLERYRTFLYKSNLASENFDYSKLPTVVVDIAANNIQSQFFANMVKYYNTILIHLADKYGDSIVIDNNIKELFYMGIYRELNLTIYTNKPKLNDDLIRSTLDVIDHYERGRITDFIKYCGINTYGPSTFELDINGNPISKSKVLYSLGRFDDVPYDKPYTSQFGDRSNRDVNDDANDNESLLHDQFVKIKLKDGYHTGYSNNIIEIQTALLVGDKPTTIKIPDTQMYKNDSMLKADFKDLSTVNSTLEKDIRLNEVPNIGIKEPSDEKLNENSTTFYKIIDESKALRELVFTEFMDKFEPNEEIIPEPEDTSHKKRRSKKIKKEVEPEIQIPLQQIKFVGNGISRFLYLDLGTSQLEHISSHLTDFVSLAQNEKAYKEDPETYDKILKEVCEVSNCADHNNLHLCVYDSITNNVAYKCTLEDCPKLLQLRISPTVKVTTNVKYEQYDNGRTFYLTFNDSRIGISTNITTINTYTPIYNFTKELEGETIVTDTVYVFTSTYNYFGNPKGTYRIFIGSEIEIENKHTINGYYMWYKKSSMNGKLSDEQLMRQVLADEVLTGWEEYGHFIDGVSEDYKKCTTLKKLIESHKANNIATSFGCNSTFSWSLLKFENGIDIIDDTNPDTRKFVPNLKKIRIESNTDEYNYNKINTYLNKFKYSYYDTILEGNYSLSDLDIDEYKKFLSFIKNNEKDKVVYIFNKQNLFGIASTLRTKLIIPTVEWGQNK